MLNPLLLPVLASLLLQTAAPAQSAPEQGPTVLSAQQQLAKAEARYRAAIELQPDIAAYHHSLGVILERQQRVDEALTSYAKAVGLDSLSARHHAGYGELLLRLRRFDAGAAQLRAAIRLDPFDVQNRHTLARALMQREQWAEAATLLDEAARLAPDDARIASALAEAQARTAKVQDGYHDLSDFEDEAGPSLALTIGEVFFGALLLGAGVVLLMPVLGLLFLLVVQAPLAWKRGTLSARG